MNRLPIPKGAPRGHAYYVELAGRRPSPPAWFLVLLVAAAAFAVLH